jgi:hypothetical protein
MVLDQRASTSETRTAVWVICLTALIAAIMLATLKYYRACIESWLESNIDFLREYPSVVLAASLVLTLPIIFGGVYFLRFGCNTVQAQRFPPLGYAVLRGTVVLEGPRAVTRGRIIQGLAILLLLMAIALPLSIWYVFRSLASTI